MGFKGLETFIDSLYKESKGSVQSPFQLKKLSELKLVIDGTDFTHTLCKDLYFENEYGGNYNQIYIQIKQLFSQLKPFVEIVIFDGTKEDSTRSLHKYEEKISKLTNKNNLTTFDYLNIFKGTPPLFMKNILYEVLTELEINFSMTEGSSDHAVACYANGHNPQNKRYTVLARNTYYYAYKLVNGFLSVKYFVNYIKDLKESTQVPVYYSSELLIYLKLTQFKTWLYFCIIMGDYNLDLERNVQYLRQRRVNSRNGNFIEIINHLRQIENTPNNFFHLRSTYSRDQLKLVDKVLEMFEFKNTEYDLLISDESAILNDFDRFVLNIKDSNKCYLTSLVEDYTEKTVFNICQQNGLLKHLYAFFTDQIEEYSRNQLPSNQLAQVNRVKSEMCPEKFNDTVLFYLKDLNKMNSMSQTDNMSILMVSLALWYDWLKHNAYTNKLNPKITPDSFINAIIFNLIIIRLKNLDSFNNNTRYDALLSKLNLDWDANYEILNLYDKILTEPNENFFSTELRLVHRLNEFQAVYYVMSVISQQNEFQFGFLSPAFLFDSIFVVKYVQEYNVNGSDCFWLSIRLEENKEIHETFETIKQEFKKCLAFVTPEEDEKVVDLNKKKEVNDKKEEQDLTHLLETLSLKK